MTIEPYRHRPFAFQGCHTLVTLEIALKEVLSTDYSIPADNDPWPNPLNYGPKDLAGVDLCPDCGEIAGKCQHEQPDPLIADVRTGDWLDGQSFPELQYAIPGLIPEGLTLLVGPPKAGKSWLVLAFCLAVASGGAALGKIRIPKAGRVLYLALEDGDRRMQTRSRSLLGPGVPIPALFGYKVKLKPGELMPVIRAWMATYPDTAMIVIDTLGKVLPPTSPGESSYQRDYRVVAEIKEVADDHPGLSIVLTHHDRKANTDDFVDSVSGTNGLAGAADEIAVLCRNRQSREAVVKVTGRDVPELEYALVLDASNSWQLDGADLTEAAAVAETRQERGALGDVSNEILTFIKGNLAGVRRADVAKEFPDVSGIDMYLKRLSDSGRVDKLGRGLYVALGN